MGIRENVCRILSELPQGVHLVAAAKTRNPQEILEAVEAGVRMVGENYVQEAASACGVIGNRAEWHLIGHLQTNKVKKAVTIFDMIQTVDSVEIATEIDKRCARIGKTMPVLIEINSGREKQKAGVFPENAEQLIRAIAPLPNIRVQGLMTMGPPVTDPEHSRPYFRETKKTFDAIRNLNLTGVEMRYLSMGMSDSYGIALAEGANMVRIGRKIFGDAADDKEEDY